MGLERCSPPLQARALILLAVPAILAGASRASSSERQTPPETVHLVEAGQTLWSIAHAHGVRLEDLLRANQIADPTVIVSGQELRIPARSGRRKIDPATLHLEPEPGRPTLAWPLKGQLTSLYGRRGRSPHTGVDIAATPGTIIVAAAPGTVVRTGRWGRYGKVVLIEHRDGLVTLYAHASRSFVTEGETVRKGQAIAAVGRTGNATGPHLHFEIWHGDRTVDPLQYLQIPEDLRAALFSR